MIFASIISIIFDEILQMLGDFFETRWKHLASFNYFQTKFNVNVQMLDIFLVFLLQAESKRWQLEVQKAILGVKEASGSSQPPKPPVKRTMDDY